MVKEILKHQFHIIRKAILPMLLASFLIVAVIFRLDWQNDHPGLGYPVFNLVQDIVFGGTIYAAIVFAALLCVAFVASFIVLVTLRLSKRPAADL